MLTLVLAGAISGAAVIPEKQPQIVLVCSLAEPGPPLTAEEACLMAKERLASSFPEVRFENTATDESAGLTRISIAFGRHMGPRLDAEISWSAGADQQHAGSASAQYMTLDRAIDSNTYASLIDELVRISAGQIRQSLED